MGAGLGRPRGESRGLDLRRWRAVVAVAHRDKCRVRAEQIIPLVGRPLLIRRGGTLIATASTYPRLSRGGRATRHDRVTRALAAGTTTLLGPTLAARLPALTERRHDGRHGHRRDKRKRNGQVYFGTEHFVASARGRFAVSIIQFSRKGVKTGFLTPLVLACTRAVGQRHLGFDRTPQRAAAVSFNPQADGAT